MARCPGALEEPPALRSHHTTWHCAAKAEQLSGPAREKHPHGLSPELSFPLGKDQGAQQGVLP